MEMNIAIMRTFIALRKIAVNYKELVQLLTEMGRKYDRQFTEVYNALAHLIHPPPPARSKIGFIRDKETD